MIRPSTLKAIYWSFWGVPLLLYLLGLIGHWPGWIEKSLMGISFPWSLATMDLSNRLETSIGFGWISFFAQIGLFVLLPATLDYFLVVRPLLKRWERRKNT